MAKFKVSDDAVKAWNDYSVHNKVASDFMDGFCASLIKTVRKSTIKERIFVSDKDVTEEVTQTVADALIRSKAKAEEKKIVCEELRSGEIAYGELAIIKPKQEEKPSCEGRAVTIDGVKYRLEKA